MSTWIDTVAESVEERRIKLPTYQSCEAIKRNRTIMDYVSEYVKDKKDAKEISKK